MIKVEVTEEDIRHGVRSDPLQCPVALAVTRSLGVDAGLVEVVLDLHIGVLHRTRLRYEATYKILAKVQEFADRFDAEKLVKPFSFYLRRTKGAR